MEIGVVLGRESACPASYAVAALKPVLSNRSIAGCGEGAPIAGGVAAVLGQASEVA
jgi:hypothetical protein